MSDLTTPGLMPYADTDRTVRSSFNPEEFIEFMSDATGKVWVLVPDITGESVAYAMRFTLDDLYRVEEALDDAIIDACDAKHRLGKESISNG